MRVPDIDPHFLKEEWPDFISRLEQQGSVSIESLHKSKSGRIIPVDVTLNYLMFEGNAYIMASARDITERKQAEKELKQNIEDLQKFTDMAIGREERMIDLKEEINGLLGEMGKSPKYKIVE